MAHNILARSRQAFVMANRERAQAAYWKAARDFDHDDPVVLMIDLQEDGADIVLGALGRGRVPPDIRVNHTGRSTSRFLFGAVPRPLARILVGAMSKRYANLLRAIPMPGSYHALAILKGGASLVAIEFRSASERGAHRPG